MIMKNILIVFLITMLILSCSDKKNQVENTSLEEFSLFSESDDESDKFNEAYDKVLNSLQSNENALLMLAALMNNAYYKNLDSEEFEKIIKILTVREVIFNDPSLSDILESKFDSYVEKSCKDYGHRCNYLVKVPLARLSIHQQMYNIIYQISPESDWLSADNSPDVWYDFKDSDGKTFAGLFITEGIRGLIKDWEDGESFTYQTYGRHTANVECRKCEKSLGY